ncbi:MAG: DUF2911 domain-containing protein [Acidobacteria bacterium]|nr:DUF2911 domain-containing protein [Acidobacteriota bacterium]
MKLNRSILTNISLTVSLTLLIVSALAHPQKPSPPKTAEMTLNGKKITINYSAPSMRGRKIFGGLEPYNRVWRLGADEATRLTTEANLMFGNVEVPKGTYTLFAWISETGWKLIINKQTGIWGIPYKPEYEKTELARINMKVEKTKAPVELMVISLEKAGQGGVLKMEWENTSASVNFTEKK